VTATAATHHAEVHEAAPPPRGWRRLLGPGWLRVPWMTALFFGIGLGLTLLFRWAEGWHPIWDGQVITTVELAAAPIGFLAGIGGFDYWFRYAIGSPTRLEDHSGHGATTSGSTPTTR
jgi:cytochrome c oxidase subunit I